MSKDDQTRFLEEVADEIHNTHSPEYFFDLYDLYVTEKETVRDPNMTAELIVLQQCLDTTQSWIDEGKDLSKVRVKLTVDEVYQNIAELFPPEAEPTNPAPEPAL